MITEDGTANGKFLGLVTDKDYRITRSNLDETVEKFMVPKEKLVFARKGITLSEANDIVTDYIASMTDDYFIDLYLLLYSKLRQGSRARLQGTVENYINTLDGQAKTDVSEVMLKLSRYLLNLLSLYEDHVAVPKLRDIYHSATIINFCNVASQALSGIDNFDNLLSFKMMLVERKTNVMRKRQQAILRNGERSIYAIWIILIIFVVVGWWSKLPKGFF